LLPNIETFADGIIKLEKYLKTIELNHEKAANDRRNKKRKQD
jgi:hypothetical protein